jgi:hypothetical protein
MLPLLGSEQQSAGFSEPLGRTSALAYAGFCGWQESALATATRIRMPLRARSAYPWANAGFPGFE